jgi:hypothetical protein
MKRKPVHKKKVDQASKRREGLLSAIGIWKDRTDLPDTETYVRSLLKGDRLERITR